MSHFIHIRKDDYKFSAAHMTVFPDGTKEPLHGHNYRTEITIEIKDPSLKGMASFSAFKSAIREICQAWDEKLLLAEGCPHLRITARAPALDFELCGKRYVIPFEEVALLPIENITTELLAEEFSRLFRAKLGDEFLQRRVDSLRIRVEEITGQGATFVWP